jgi:hypothetical protein
MPKLTHRCRDENIDLPKGAGIEKTVEPFPCGQLAVLRVLGDRLFAAHFLEILRFKAFISLILSEVIAHKSFPFPTSV